MQVEISDQYREALIKQAEESDLTVSAFLERLVQDHIHQMEQAPHRKQAIGDLIQFMETNTATSGRGDMDWREYIHQGHKY
ncbi:hypothetical protein [Granulicella sp. dw_53]|uniref:hypothetical protein n=1 Tax=Granulicella sp. dw_53 TaxID=2719792 RepID=UPI001BD5D8F8|nr:hypothetical protein [Granulicella sp. dw_53]